jgi:HK97 family phage portal protein
MTAVEFWECVVAAVLLWGNAFVAITRIGNRITALYPMRPDRVVIRRESDGSLSYTYTWAGQTQTFAESDILHIKGFSLDGYMGISPIGNARNSLGAARAAERASSSVFKNGMRPSGVLTAPEYLTDPQREDAKAILAGFKGAANTGGTPLLEGGWTWQSLSIPPEDAQLLETRAFQVEQLCRWFDVPPIMIGHMDKQTSWGTGVEQIMLHFYTSCLRAHLKRIEQAIAKSLITAADEAAGIYVEFNIDGLLRADSAARASLYSTYVQNGIMNRDDVRAKENLPPIPGGGGKEFTVQANLIPIDKLGEIASMSSDKPVQPGSAVANTSGAQATRIPEIKQ